MFRVTRNADLTLEEDEADDLLEAVELELRRAGSTRAIRLEVADNIGDELLDLLIRELELDIRQRVTAPRPDRPQLSHRSSTTFDRPDLKDRAWPPVTAGRLLQGRGDRSIDLLGHPRPGAARASSVRELLEQRRVPARTGGHRSTRVQSIKMTLYFAGGDSAIIRSLIQAAESGKQVAALVELKARFDEANNIIWARQMERAGVHVVYGFMDLKTHCKLAMVVRQEGKKVRR